MSTIRPEVTGRRRGKLPATAPPKPLTVSPKAAAALTGLSLRTVWTHILNGTLRSVVIGRRRLIVYASLEQLLFGKDAAA